MTRTGYTQLMKLSTKLFLIFLGVTASMLLMAMGLARYSFQQGFIEFVGGMEKVRLQDIAQELVVEYENNEQAWQWLRDEGLHNVLSPRSTRLPKHLQNRPPKPPPRKGGPPNRGPRPQPPPHADPSGPNEPGLRKTPATAVFDLMGDLVSGNDMTLLSETMFKVDLISNGVKIGEIRSWPNVAGSSELSSLFARQQFSSNIMIAAFCLFVAGCISWLLSRKLLIPIHQLRQSISVLHEGKYGQQINSKRTDELGELMLYVDNLSQTLDKNRSAKSRMFADISHELRTPLTVLAGEIDLIKAGIRPFNQENLLSLEQESTRLRHLVDDLYQLSLSDLGGLKYAFKKADIAKTLHSMVTSMRVRAQEKGIQIEEHIKTSALINMDEKRIEQLLSNILMNAIAYTDAPGMIKVTLTSAESELSIRIEDSAPGVDETERRKLFEPLYRVDASRSRSESGAGLGLAISKNIVDAHHGTITVCASRLGGLCMTITLPISRGLQ